MFWVFLSDLNCEDICRVSTKYLNLMLHHLARDIQPNKCHNSVIPSLQSEFISTPLSIVNYRCLVVVIHWLISHLRCVEDKWWWGINTIVVGIVFIIIFLHNVIHLVVAGIVLVVMVVVISKVIAGLLLLEHGVLRLLLHINTSSSVVTFTIKMFEADRVLLLSDQQMSVLLSEHSHVREQHKELMWIEEFVHYICVEIRVI